MVAATSDTEVDFAELKARNPLGDAVEAAGVVLHGKGRVRQGDLPLSSGNGRQLHGVRQHREVLVLRLRRRRRRAGLRGAHGGPDAARGHPASGRWDYGSGCDPLPPPNSNGNVPRLSQHSRPAIRRC